MVDRSEVRSITDVTGRELALLVTGTIFNPGVDFVTGNDLQQHVALMNRPAGYRIPAHTHLPIGRSVRGTQEVLVIQSGKMRVDIYDSKRVLVHSEILGPGDIAVLIEGGHGFSVIEECHFIEVKQGPYIPGKDKEVFEDSL